jgi:hypothetical protein
MGMTIEEIQISIATDVGHLGAHPTEAQQLQVAHRRDKLQLQIDQFSQSVGTFLGHTIDGDDIEESYRDENMVEDYYSDHGDDTPVTSSFSFHPEESFLPLPSNLGIARCKEFGLTDVGYDPSYHSNNIMPSSMLMFISNWQSLPGEL